MDKDKLKKACDKGTKFHDDVVDAMSYCYSDVVNTMNAYYGLWPVYRPKGEPNQLINLNLTITKVIFHDPATIIYWSDNTRTVVKCSEDDVYDSEKGMAMAICKKILGYKFKEIFKEYLPKEESIKKDNDDDSDVVLKAYKTMIKIGLSASEASKNLSKYSKKFDKNSK